MRVINKCLSVLAILFLLAACSSSSPEKTAKKGVQVNFLSDFCTKPEAKYEHTLILNFSDLDEDTQKEAISRLGSVFTGTT